jgi:hypothetical protein
MATDLFKPIIRIAMSAPDPFSFVCKYVVRILFYLPVKSEKNPTQAVKPEFGELACLLLGAYLGHEIEIRIHDPDVASIEGYLGGGVGPE